MKILLLKKTTDADLFKGLQVCYQNLNGVYNNLGVIESIYEMDGVKNYTLHNAIGAYTADELKLIDYEQANSFDELKQAVVTQKTFVPVSEQLYYYALEVLPPNYLKNGTFQMGECVSWNLYYTFGQKEGQYFGCLCNSNFALNNWQ